MTLNQGAIKGEGALTGLRLAQIFLIPAALSIQIPVAIVSFLSVEVALFRYCPSAAEVARSPAFFRFQHSVSLATF